MCRAHPSVRRRSSGVTLLELMITVSVVAVIAGIAVPGFDAMVLNSRRVTAVNSLVHAVFLARSTASQRGKTVSICRSVDQRSCAPSMTGWQDGWIVFVNDDRDQPPVRDENEALLAVFEALPSGTVTSNRTSYSFRPHYNGVVNGTVVFCDRRGSAHARAVIINYAGRPRVAALDSDKRPLRCPAG